MYASSKRSIVGLLAARGGTITPVPCLQRHPAAEGGRLNADNDTANTERQVLSPCRRSLS